MWKYMSSLSLSSNSGSLEVWKCGNMSSLFLSNNSGSLEMWKYVFNCLYLILNSEVWKCGNVPPLSLSINTRKCGNVEKCVFVVFIQT